AYHGLVELVGRAKVAGRLRRDFVPEDVTVLLAASAGVASAPQAWRRLLTYLLQAFAVPGTSPETALPEPPARGALLREMTR
ncbi:TetR/AcrR family transcriptional regulator, partial [Streptosporangium algeriense]